MSDLWTNIFIGVVTLIFAAYLFVRHRYAYWQRRNVPFAKPTFPMGSLGNISKTFIAVTTKRIYEEYVGKEPMVGMFFFINPAVLVIDPELVKNIMVRDFNDFHSHGVYYNEKDDPLSAHLFALDGQKWKTLRAKLTPTFTSGKMKMMFQTVLEISEDMQSYLDKSAAQGDPIDVKDILTRYTTDVIGSCAFGIDCNSIKNPEAEFRVQGNKIFEPTPTKLLKLLFATTFKGFSRKIKMATTEQETAKFFLAAVRDTVDYRKKNKVVKNDFLQLVIELFDKGGADGLATIEEVAAQAFLFFIAGFETSSTTMAFCLYELAKNPAVQDKLRTEINAVIQKHDGKVTYEALQEMKYLYKVIDETLRLYPPVGNLIREADKDYTVDGTKHVIEKGTLVFIPAYAIQRDPNYFPEPEKFEPERFNEENTAQRQSFTYLPFGEGPRICIGARFGRMQSQLGLIQILQKYKLSVCAKTPNVEFEPLAQVPALKGGFWLKISKV